MALARAMAGGGGDPASLARAMAASGGMPFGPLPPGYPGGGPMGLNIPTSSAGGGGAAAAAAAASGEMPMQLMAALAAQQAGGGAEMHPRELLAMQQVCLLC